MRQAKKHIVKAVSPGPQKDPINAAAEYGVDIPMLIANQARTPLQRIRRHQIALETFKALRGAKRV